MNDITNLFSKLFFLSSLFLILPLVSNAQHSPLMKEKVAQKTNVLFHNTLTETTEFNAFEDGYYFNGGGVSIGDINNDGLPDLYFTGNMVPDKLYLNKGNFIFEDITTTAGFLHNDRDWHTGTTFVDINNDGWLDIYVCRAGPYQLPDSLKSNLLYINQKNLTFVEQAEQYGLAQSSNSTQASFFDYDLDGDLDCYLMNIPLSTIIGSMRQDPNTYRASTKNPSDQLLINKNNKFIDQSEQLHVENNAFGLGLSIGDIDNNLYPDIYVSNDFEEADNLYYNKGNSFENQIQTRTKHISNFGMGTDLADFNNDGWLDLIQMDMAYSKHITSKKKMPSMSSQLFNERVERGEHYQYMSNTLQLNNGNGTFSDIAFLAGVAKTEWSWAVLFADFDNDGLKDIAVTNGYKVDVRDRDTNMDFSKKALPKSKENLKTVVLDAIRKAPRTKEHNYLFKNNGNLTFSNVSIPWGFDLAVNSNGLAYGDLDNDGDLDLVVNNLDTLASIYENTSSKDNNYLKVKLKGFPKNDFAIGSRVTIHTADSIQMLELQPTRGFLSSVDYTLHFGLGKNEKIDQLIVRWPNGKTTYLDHVSANQTLFIDYKNSKKSTPRKNTTTNLLLFQAVASPIDTNYIHAENYFSDFSEQVLLPHMLSKQGPSLAIGDVNGDGLEDLYVGGAKDNIGQLYLQQKDQNFILDSTQKPFFNPYVKSEDLGALFLDVDQDGDQDLYICSGGYEYKINDYRLQDRLFINENGSLLRTTNHLPKMPTSTQVVQAADFDQDGDLDLFVGGRLVPGKYPQAPRSYLLENDGTGHYKDVTQQYCPDLMQPGMVTGAHFGDVNGDGKIDLTLLGEWMPLQVFINKGKSFEKQTPQVATEGLWFSLKGVDLDGDGDLDFVGGNLGKNSKFKGKVDKPFNIYGDDFDNNGTWDMMMSSYEGDKNYPVRGRDCSSEQMPSLVDSFPSFQAFAVAEITDICGPKINDALHLTARHFYTSFFINDGQGNFTLKKLPSEAQFSPIKDIHAEDLNQDGHIDLILVGNMYDTEVETVRYDAGRGLVLLGEGQGKFKPLSPLESGFFAWENVKQIRKIKVGERELYVLAVNQGKLMTFEKLPLPKTKQ